MILKSLQKIKPIHFLETILQIIEEKTISYPKSIYCLMIIILYSHYAGYIFSTYTTKTLFDEKIIFFAHWNEYSPGTFLLFVSGMDKLTIAIAIIMHFILTFYVFYIMILTILRISFPLTLIHIKFLVKIINSFYQIFFSSFLWVLYIPFTEIHAGLLVIGSNSFLVEFREAESYSTKPFIYIYMGVMGIIMTLLTGIILSYCYISYDFYDGNLLKRSFKPNLILQLFARSLLVSLYYINIENILIIKYIIGHILGITALYDFFCYIPFRDSFICLFYASVTCIYESAIVLFTFWELTEILPQYNLFFLWVVPTPFIIVFISVYYNRKYFNLLRLHPQNIEKNTLYGVAFFLETIYELTLTGQDDKIKKMKLLGLMEQFYKKDIHGAKLFERMKYRMILNENKEINRNKIISILNEMFQLFLKTPQICQNQEIYEEILMKYCTFLSKFQNNPIKAFYELKKLLVLGQRQNNNQNRVKKSQKPSIIFTIVSNLISEQIEAMISDIFMFKYQINLDTKVFLHNTNTIPDESKLNIAFLPRVNEICLSTIPEYIKLVKLKISFFENLLSGFHSISDARNSGFLFVKACNRMKGVLEDHFSHIQHISWRENLINLKLQSIFERLILNNRLNSMVLEKKLQEIIKKDSLIVNMASRSSFIQSRSIILTISLLKEGGVIINKITHKIAGFFGYTLMEFQGYCSIHRLMPLIFSGFHQLLVDRFIKKGPATVFDVERPVYALHKTHYIFPITLKLTLSFYFVNDYCVSGLMTKIDSSSLDLLYTEEGSLIGITESLKEEMPGLKKIEVDKLYSGLNFFVFMPDLLEKVMKEDVLEGYLARKELTIEIFRNKIMPFYFVKDFEEVFKAYNMFIIKNFDSNKGRKFYRRFLNSNSSKKLFDKKLVQFNLRLEVFPLKDKKYQQIYCIQIKNVFENTDQDDMLSYSAGLSSSTMHTTQTVITSRSNNTHKSSNVIEVNEKNMNKNHNNVNLNKNVDNNNIMDNLNIDNDNENENDPQLKQIPLKNNTLNIKMFSKTKIVFRNLQINREISDINEDDDRCNQYNKHGIISDDENSSKKEETSSNNTNNLQLSSNSNIQKASSLKSNTILMRTNTGEFILKSIVDNKKPTLILKKIFLLSIFQITFFFAINLLYQALVTQRISNLEESQLDIMDNLLFINSYYKTSFIFTILLINNNNLLDNNDSFLQNKEFLQESLQKSYEQIENLQQELLLQKSIGHFNLSLYQNNLYESMINQSFTLSQSSVLISSFIYEAYKNFMDFQFSEVFLYNFETIDSKNYEYLYGKYNAFGDMKTDMKSLYLTLSFTAIIVGLLLQIIGVPYMKAYNIFLEKIYFLITRLQEKECELEILKLKTGLNRLESENEAYLTYDFEKLDEIKQFVKFERDDNLSPRKEKSKKPKKSYNVSYLSSKISNMKLSYCSNYVFLSISLLIVGLYYMGVFIYMTKMQQILDNSSDLIRYTGNYYIGLNKMDLTRMFILLNKNEQKNNESTIIKGQNLLTLKEDIQNWVRFLQNSNSNGLKARFSDELGDLFENYRSFLEDDLCLKQNKSFFCEELLLMNLKFGIQGYASFLYNRISQISYLLNNTNDLDKETIKTNILLENGLNETLRSWSVLNEALNGLALECESLVSSLLKLLDKEMVWLLLIGGMGCSFFWMVISVVKYKQMQTEINLSKEMLRMIPLTKLSDEGTMHLLKMLETY